MTEENVTYNLTIQNLDDYVDYKDAENDLESNYEQDSFNNDIMKLYEDHKKNGTGVKPSEIQNNNRPISSYHRGMSGTKREEENETNNENPNIDTIIDRFGRFIHKNKISQNVFMDNPQIFCNLEDFSDLFKKIKFEISQGEISLLFNNNNPSINEGFILGQKFLDNYSNVIWQQTQPVSNNSPRNTYNFDIKKINEEFASLKNDVFDIVEKVSRTKSSMKMKRTVISAVDQNSKKILKNPNADLRPLSNINMLKNNLIPDHKFDKKNTQPRIKPASAYPNFKSFLKDTQKKKQAEEEIMRLAIEKRNRENEKDCIKKMSEANQYAEELGVPKSYSAYMDESEGMLLCRIYDKETRKTYDIDFKKFIFEWKKLKKLINVKFNLIFSKKNKQNTIKTQTKINLKQKK